MEETFVKEFIDMEMILETRQWMKMSKVWRLSFVIPDQPFLLPSLLTSLIDKYVRLQINDITLDPAYVVDVPPKGKRFHLVAETAKEDQNWIGPRITALAGTQTTVSITAQGQVLPEKAATELTEERKRILMGIHILFQNVKFREYLSTITAREILEEKTAAAIFRELNGVESCRDLPDETINDWRNNFNLWLKEGRGR